MEKEFEKGRKIKRNIMTRERGVEFHTKNQKEHLETKTERERERERQGKRAKD